MKKLTITFFLPLFFALTAYSQRTILDTFDSNANSWWEGESHGGSQHVRDGKLYTDFPDGGWVISIKPYVEFEKDFKLESSFKEISGVENNGIGLVWGYDKTLSQQNYFIVSSTGYYYITNTTAEKDNSPSSIRQWVKSDLIKPLGQTNVLKVEQSGSSLSFYINGEKVATTPKFRWSGSEIGFVTFVKMYVEVDDFSFHQDGIVINLPPNLTKGFVKENLGPGVNTAIDDLIPRISVDGKTLYFGRENYVGNLGGVADGEDFYVSTYNGTEWGKAENMGSPVNSTGVDNISSVSSDNNKLLFVDATKFWTRSRTESGWSDTPEELGVTYVNEAGHFEACISADGKAVLFTAKSSNNIAYNKDIDERDVYVSYQDQNDHWSTPINLGTTVNTRGDEASPFLAADGRTLYYASNGLPGYGDKDIFMTKRLGDGWTKWTEPVNLGPEINSVGYDAYYVIPASGDYAYMVSNQNGYGLADVVRIKLAKELKPDPVVLVRGKTLDAKTKKPISADVLIGNLITNIEVGEAISDPKTGDFQIVLPYGFNYGFHATAPGYLSVSENLELLQISNYTELEKDLYLVPIRVGETIQLNNVFFEQAKPALKAESFPELDRLVTIMKENPTMEIELNGYTDDIGRPVSLIALSMDRVGTVKRYMMDHGIAGQRITGKGYGPSNPVVKNDTEEHRRMNRRVEFKIVKK